MMRRWTCMLALAATAAACSGGPGSDAGAPPSTSLDAGGAEDAGPADMVVEIGTGVDDFIPLEVGQAVEITLGPQGGGRSGGFHIWHAVRVWNAEPRDVLLSFETLSADSGALLGAQARRVNLRPSGEAFVAYGIAPWLTDCCLAQDQDVIMSVEVRDAEGRVGVDQRRVRAGQCLDHEGASVCP